MNAPSIPRALPRITDLVIRRRFLRLVRCAGDLHGRWLWIGARASNGYGVFKYEGRAVGAHRISYALFVDSIPEGVTVNHKSPVCGVAPSILDVRPDHLELMTMAANIAERNRRRASSIASAQRRCVCGSFICQYASVCESCRS